MKYEQRLIVETVSVSSLPELSYCRGMFEAVPDSIVVTVDPTVGLYHGDANHYHEFKRILI